jgi:hypothetical protein
MTTQQKIDLLIDRITELPHEAQTELVERIIGWHGERLGVYEPAYV